MMTKDQWIKEAEERITNNIGFINEVNNMVGSDWSRHRSRMESSVRENVFLTNGIKLLKEREND